MKRILITSAGGAPAAGVIRSLKEAPEQFYIVGVDADKYTINRSEADETYLVPEVGEDDYLDVLRDIIASRDIDFVHVQLSKEILTVSRNRDNIGARTFLPKQSTIEALEDKLASYGIWKSAGLPVPWTMLIRDEDDLREAFAQVGARLWLRAIRGSAGKGSLPTSEFHIAKAWIDFNEGWGDFTASECLSDRNIAWQSVWKDGQLLAAQARKILTWEFGNRAPSGVSGSAGVGQTVSDPELDRIGIGAVMAVDREASGAFSVDITYDMQGQPKITEINCGRFPTSGHFLTRAGLNLPYIYVKAGFDEELPVPVGTLNPLPDGLIWVRGMDVEPVMTDVEQVRDIEQTLSERRERLRSERLVKAV
jgi:carbamoyl-phosphate synthase large subunit